MLSVCVGLNCERLLCDRNWEEREIECDVDISSLLILCFFKYILPLTYMDDGMTESLVMRLIG